MLSAAARAARRRAQRPRIGCAIAAKRAKLASVMSANGRQRRGGRNRRSGDRPRPATDENGSPNTLEQMGDARDKVRLVFLNAPRRKISCYGPDKPTEAWHDYFSDHGGAEGRPEIEEDIDLHHLAESRRLVHAAMDGEAARYGGDYGRVALFGESQGGCTALDAATTHAKCVGGVFCSFGQLYSATPVSSSNKQLKVVVWHGSRDATIAPSLCLRSLSRLLDRGYKKLTLHAEDGLGHCEFGDRGLRRQGAENWGFVSRDKPRRVSHAAAPPPAKPELVEAPKKVVALKPARRVATPRRRWPQARAKPASPRPAKKTPPGSRRSLRPSPPRRRACIAAKRF
ncbi:hypothetical protein JL721_11283 [Aureococcus anophagefferens]|nr:hypothetical protein JL721_11283 [Aureococcus anophagefferens]